MNADVSNALTAGGYRKIQDYACHSELYAKTEGFRARLVLFVDDAGDPTLTVSWLNSMRRYLEGVFAQHNFTEINLLLLVRTNRIGVFQGASKSLAPIWFLDVSAKHIVIFENQPADFDGLYDLLIRFPFHANARTDAYTRGSYAENTYTDGWRASRRTADRGKKERIFAFIKGQGPINLIMIAINVIVFIVLSIMGNTENAYFMAMHGAMYPPMILQEHTYYQLVTSMFLHFGLSHIFNNMLVLFFLGDNLERAVGKWKYLVIYLGGGLCGNLLSLFVSLQGDVSNYTVSAGASGAIFAVIGALLYIVIRNHGHLEELRTRNLIFLIVVTLYHGLTSAGVDNSAHIGGLIGGFLLAVMLYQKTKSCERSRW